MLPFKLKANSACSCSKQTSQSSYSPSKISQQSMLNSTLVTEIVSNSFSESKKNFCRLAPT